MITAAEPIKGSTDFSFTGSGFVDHLSANDTNERFPVNRLRDVGIEAGPQRPIAFLGPGLSGHRHQPGPRGRARGPHLFRDLVSVDVGQVDVQQHDVRVGAIDLVQRRAPAVDRHHRMPFQLQEQPHGGAHLGVILDDQHARGCAVRPARQQERVDLSLLGGRLGQRQRHHELGSPPPPFAGRSNAAAVKVDQFLREPNPMPSPPRQVSPTSDWTKGSKIRPRSGGGMPRPQSRTPMRALSPTRLQADGHLPAPVAEFRRVVDQVRRHLRQPHRVGVGRHRLGWQRHLQVDALGIDCRLPELDRALGRPHAGRWSRAVADLAVGEARNLQQVLDEAAQVRQLPANETVHARHPRVLHGQPLQRIGRNNQRHQRGAQLVRQGGQKLVLHPIGALVLGLARGGFGALAFDPDAHGDGGGGLAALAKQLDEHRDLRAQDIGVERLDHEIDRAAGVSGAHLVRLELERGQEDDRASRPPSLIAGSGARPRNRPGSASAHRGSRPRTRASAPAPAPPLPKWPARP